MVPSRDATRWIGIVAAVVGTGAEGSADAAELAYDTHEIDTGEAEWRLILPGPLTGAATEDLVVYTRSGQTQGVAVFSDDGDGFSRLHTTDLPGDIYFLDLMRSADGVALVARGLGRFVRIDPATGALEPLLPGPPPGGGSDGSGTSEQRFYSPFFAVFDFARDLDGDGHDDVLVAPWPMETELLPDAVNDFRVWIQRSGGEFADPVVFATTPQIDSYVSPLREDAGTWQWAYEIRRIDHDGDGMDDLALLAQDGGLAVHRGLAAGSWAARPVSYQIKAGTLSTRIDRSRGKNLGRPHIRGVDDYNGDGVGDVATVTVTGWGSTRYDFHFGRREGGGTVLPETGDTSVSVEGTIMLDDLSDLDGDGDWDLCAGSVDEGQETVFSVLFSGSVRVDLACYRMDDGVFAAAPSVQWSVRVPRNAPTPFAFADVTGDGFLDVVVPATGNGLEVYAGTGGSDLFAQDPTGVELLLPSSGGELRFRDLNRDGRADMLIVPQDSARPVRVALSR